MKIIYFGNGTRGIRCLEELLNMDCKIQAVIGHHDNCDLILFAGNMALPVLCPEKVNDPLFLDQLSKYQPDLFVLAGYNKILKKEIISIPRFGSINLHGGKLPDYRGVAPINWQIIRGEKEGGCCIISLDEGIDTGDILIQEFYEIGINDTAQTIVNKQLDLFPSMLRKVVQKIETGQIKGIKQNPLEGAYFTRRYPGDGLISWKTMSAGQSHNMIRALTGPYPPAFCYYNGKKYYILGSKLLEEKIMGVPGRIALRRKEGTVVIAKDHGILLTHISTETGNCPLSTFKLGDNLNSNPNILF